MKRLVTLLALLSVMGCDKTATLRPYTAEAYRGTRPPSIEFDPAALERLGLKVMPAGSSDTRSRLRVSGTLEYNLEHYAEVGVVAEGRIASLGVRLGERVVKGQPLAVVMVPSIARAESDFVAARAAAGVARDHAERQEGLLAQRLTTAREHEIAMGDVGRTSADLHAATARLRILGVGHPSDAAVSSGAGHLVLRSPIGGVVVRRDAIRGKFVVPTDTMFVVAEPDELWATLEMFEIDLGAIAIGTEVVLTVDGMPGRAIAGKVALIEPTVRGDSRAARARVAISNTDGALRPGLFVRATIVIAAPPATTLIIPAAALQPLGGIDVVFVQRQRGSYAIRPVVVVRRTPQGVEIGEGLARGEPVVTEGAFLLRGEASKR